MADSLEACDPALRELYQAELDTHLPVLSEGLLALEKDANQPKLLESMMRAAHSIKGAARIVQLENTVRISHVLEDCLVAAQNGTINLDSARVDVLLRGVDLLVQVSAGAGADEATVRNIVADIESVSRQEPPIEANNPPPVKPQPPRQEIQDSVPDLSAEFVAEAREHLANVNDDLLHLEKATSDDRHRKIERLFRSMHSVKSGAKLVGKARTGELAHALETTLEKLRTGLLQPRATVIDALLAGHDRLQAMLDDTAASEQFNIAGIIRDLESLASTPMAAQDPAMIADAGSASDSDKATTIRIPVQILDKLMNLTGELVLARNQAQRALDPDDIRMRQVVQRISSITVDLQQAVMLTRMQPVSQLFGKFPRLVRDLARQLEKRIEITLRGTEVELDKNILSLLSDPLNHLVRNCCDHGIELPADRIAAGKPPEGHLLLQASHEGGLIHVELRDDGRGIDPARLRRKAIERGFKTVAELGAMSDAEVQAMVLLPGFSTAEQVTELSGRGIGMDVVRSNVEQLGGSLQIDSTVGVGTTIHLRLPLTLAIIPCLLIKQGGHRYALPQKDLEELVCVYQDQVASRIEFAHEHPVYRLRDKLIRLIRLEDVLASKSQNAGAADSKSAKWNRNMHHIAIVKVGGDRFGLVVDELLDTEEIVVKPMHPVLKSLRYFTGCTILGDGKVALILDIEGIARTVGIYADAARAVSTTKAATTSEQQSFLIFKSGPSEQFAIPLAMIQRIERISIDQAERIADEEYHYANGKSARLVRLDKFLSVSQIPKKDNYLLLLPKHVRMPIAILLDEIVDTVEVRIELDTESYRAKAIMGTAVVLNRLTLLRRRFVLAFRFR